MSMRHCFSQVGRAGRDGQPSVCVAYLHPKDIISVNSLLQTCPHDVFNRVHSVFKNVKSQLKAQAGCRGAVDYEKACGYNAAGDAGGDDDDSDGGDDDESKKSGIKVKRLLLMAETHHQGRFIQHVGFTRKPSTKSSSAGANADAADSKASTKDEWQLGEDFSEYDLVCMSEIEAQRLEAMRAQGRKALQDSIRYFTTNACHTELLEHYFSG